MGMFDHVNFKMQCPKCDTTLDRFQTKDGMCTLAKVDIDYLQSFYELCKCGAWIEFLRPSPDMANMREKPYTLEEAQAIGFEMKVTKIEVKNE